MRRLFAPAALAAFAFAVLPTLALADEAEDLLNYDAAGIPRDSTPVNPNDTSFDLGVDVGNVPNTAAAVHKFILGLGPEQQSIIMSTCEHYMEHPQGLQSEDTYSFCQIAVGG